MRPRTTSHTSLTARKRAMARSKVPRRKSTKLSSHTRHLTLSPRASSGQPNQVTLRLATPRRLWPWWTTSWSTSSRISARRVRKSKSTQASRLLLLVSSSMLSRGSSLVNWRSTPSSKAPRKSRTSSTTCTLSEFKLVNNYHTLISLMETLMSSSVSMPTLVYRVNQFAYHQLLAINVCIFRDGIKDFHAASFPFFPLDKIPLELLFDSTDFFLCNQLAIPRFESVKFLAELLILQVTTWINLLTCLFSQFRIQVAHLSTTMWLPWVLTELLSAGLQVPAALLV